MFSKTTAFFLCALVIAVAAGDKVKKDTTAEDAYNYENTGYDGTAQAGQTAPFWEKFKPVVGFTRDEQGFQKTLNVPGNPFFQGIKVNVKPFPGGYVQIKTNGAEIIKPLVGVSDSVDNQEAEIILEPQGEYYPPGTYYPGSEYTKRSVYDNYYPYNYGYGYNYGRLAYPQYWWKQSYQTQGPYNPQYIRDSYYPQQYQDEYYYPEGEYQSYDRVVRDVVGKKDKKVGKEEKKEPTEADQAAKLLYAYPRIAAYSGLYRLPQYYPDTYGQQYGQQYYGQQYYGQPGYYYPNGYNSAYYGRTPFPVYQKNYFDLVNAYRGGYEGNYLGGQYPYYRTPKVAGQTYEPNTIKGTVY